jgi:hypothetical protein
VALAMLTEMINFSDYPLFGKLQSIVTPFLSNSSEAGHTTFSGRRTILVFYDAINIAIVSIMRLRERLWPQLTPP